MVYDSLAVVPDNMTCIRKVYIFPKCMLLAFETPESEQANKLKYVYFYHDYKHIKCIS